MGFGDIQNDPELMAALQQTRLPQYNFGPGQRPTTYDWLDQIAHAMSLGLMGRGGIGQPSLPGRVLGGQRAFPRPMMPGDAITMEKTADPLFGTGGAAVAQPSGNVAERMREVLPATPKKAPRFSATELNAAVARVKGGVEGATDELAEMLKGVIGKVSRRYAPQLKSGAMDVNDLMQEGHELGQTMATGAEVSHGRDLMPYFVKGLTSRFRELVDQSGNLKMPRDEARQLSKLNQANALFAKLRGRGMTPEELQEATGIPAAKIREIYKGQAAEKSLRDLKPQEGIPLEEQ